MRHQFICLFLFSNVLFAQSSNYLIVENPSQLRILNKFEQTLGQSESAKLYPFMPLEIIDSRVLMSDHLTTGIKVKSGTDIYILLSDANGQPVNIASAGSWKIYEGVKPVPDTISILIENRIYLHEGTGPASSILRPLKMGEKALRVFSWNGWTYLYSMTTQKAGWASLGMPGESWHKISVPDMKFLSLSEIESDIQGVLDKTNSLLYDIFNALNKVEQRSEVPPRWELKRENNKMACVIMPTDKAPAFMESIVALRLEIENTLIGTPFKVLRHGFVIEIEKR
ncbi:hypothetical protein JNM05_03655 [bacterium]|nr:hypothetical protein [bacterium]